MASSRDLSSCQRGGTPAGAQVGMHVECEAGRQPTTAHSAWQRQQQLGGHSPSSGASAAACVLLCLPRPNHLSEQEGAPDERQTLKMMKHHWPSVLMSP